MSETQQNSIEIPLSDFTQRLRQGETPSISQYVQQYPEFAEEISRIFPSVQMLEQTARKHAKGHSRENVNCPPEHLGDYRICRQIGKGGMGIVYEAEQVSLGRHVALKVLPPHIFLEAKQVQRFEREARIAARLHHTNIVPVFGVGEDEGYHYYVMQLIEGVGLDIAFCKAISSETDNDLPSLPGFQIECHKDYWNAIATIGIQAAEALAYAHSQGTLHRDIKPANLLLDEQGVVWITDFGLARALEQEAVSQTSEIAGTLRYMAPEQLKGHTDSRSDIYSLGLTLYELLAKKPAFEDTNPSTLVQRITQSSVARLRKINPYIPRDLETIISKATASDAQNRYCSAAELARDFECFLEDRPIHARRTSVVEHVLRWGRRNPMLATLSALSVVLLLAITFLSTFGYLQLRGAYQQVDQALEEARHSEKVAITAADQAMQERDRTKKEYERAESNLEIAMSAFDEISEKLASRQLPQSVQQVGGEAGTLQLVGGLSTEDAQLVQSLLKFYDDFSNRNVADDVVDFATAKVYRRMGDIHTRLGKYDQAAAAYNRALSVCNSLEKEVLRTEALRSFCAQTCNLLGKSRLKQGDFVGAIAAHQRALNHLGTSTPKMKQNSLLKYDRALTLNDLVQARSAQYIYQQGRRGPRRAGQEKKIELPSEVFREYHLAHCLLRELLGENHKDRRYLLALARCHRGILPAAWANQDDDLTKPAKAQAIAIFQDLAQAEQNNASLQFELADALAMTSQTDRKSPLLDVEVSDLEQSISIATHLHQQYPTALEYTVLLANSQNKLGAHYLAKNKLQESTGHLSKAVTLFASLVNSLPDNPLFEVSLARARWELSDSLRREGSLQKSREVLEQAIAHYTAYRKTEAGRKSAIGMLVGLYRELAHTLEQMGEKELARQASRTADRLRNPPR